MEIKISENSFYKEKKWDVFLRIIEKKIYSEFMKFRKKKTFRYLMCNFHIHSGQKQKRRKRKEKKR